MSSHERLASRHGVKKSSEKSFGVVFCIFFLMLGLYPLINDKPVKLIFLVIAAIFSAVAFVAPILLKPLNTIWVFIGLTLHKVVSPVILGLLFFVFFVPAGILYRLFNKDPLNLNFEKIMDSYWKTRIPPGPEPDQLKDQF